MIGKHSTTRLSLTAVGLCLVALTCAQAEDQPQAPLAVLEGKLHGTWDGSGPCTGGLIVNADGTYQRKLHGPGGYNSAGTWEVRWDALPPTLVLTCQTSDNPADAGEAFETKLILLDDAELVLQYREQPPAKYTRASEAPPEATTPPL